MVICKYITSYIFIKLLVGMATGWVRARFLHTRTRPAGPDLRPGPDLIIKWIFLVRPKLAPPGPARLQGPI